MSGGWEKPTGWAEVCARAGGRKRYNAARKRRKQDRRMSILMRMIRMSRRTWGLQAALAGLVVFSVVALCIYYTDPKETFDEMVRVRTEAVVALKTGHKEEAIRQIQHWDLLTRMLQVGAFIRTGGPGPEATKHTENLRERLEELRDALLAGNLSKARERLPAVEAAYRECRKAYLPLGGTRAETAVP
jgi:hypothetical protein